MLSKSEFHNHLTNDLLPFWSNLYDNEYGGFYGSVDNDNNINKKAYKSAVLQTRILWFYSSCYKSLKDEKLLKLADLQFDFINKYMLDPADGGICWSVEYDGKIKDGGKHTYALAFALYAVSAYYSAGKNENALAAADRLFNLIENDYKDKYGYKECEDSAEPHTARSHDGKRLRSMNTLLHIIEAYTEYYQAVRSEQARNALKYSLNLVINNAYNDDLCRIDCYFDEFMNPVGDMLSYGHDIEASWLIYRACEILADDEITKKLAPKLEKAAQNVISKGFVDEGRNGLYYDCADGVDNKHRSWWVMSEAIVALVHQYNLYKNDKSMVIAENLWDYTKANFISPYGEWYAIINDSGELRKGSDGLCGAWKCPYHNGRMCLEMIAML
jgi:mannobiose 2-epimerase